jgi:hypothetical protein
MWCKDGAMGRRQCGAVAARKSTTWLGAQAPPRMIAACRSSCKDDDSAVTGGGVDRFARTSVGGSVAKRREGLLPLVALW